MLKLFGGGVLQVTKKPLPLQSLSERTGHGTGAERRRSLGFDKQVGKSGTTGTKKTSKSFWRSRENLLTLQPVSRQRRRRAEDSGRRLEKNFKKVLAVSGKAPNFAPRNSPEARL